MHYNYWQTSEALCNTNNKPELELQADGTDIVLRRDKRYISSKDPLHGYALPLGYRKTHDRVHSYEILTPTKVFLIIVG